MNDLEHVTLEGLEDGVCGVVERSAREHARELLGVRFPSPEAGVHLAASYLKGWLRGNQPAATPSPEPAVGARAVVTCLQWHPGQGGTVAEWLWFPTSEAPSGGERT